MKTSVLGVRVLLFIGMLVCAAVFFDTVPGEAMGGVAKFFTKLTIVVVAVVVLFPIFTGETFYGRIVKKRRAIKKLIEIVTRWSDSHYHPSSDIKTDPKFVELDLTLPSKRKRTQKLLDSLIAERALKVMEEFNSKSLAENELGEITRRLKKLDPKLVGSMTRKEIQAPLDDLKRIEKKAMAAKSEYHDLRKLVHDAGFESWEKIECYLALKIN